MHARAGHPAKKARATEPENWTTATQQSQLHDRSDIGSNAADASLQLLDSSARPGTPQRASQGCSTAVMAGSRRDTQPEDDPEWSDDDDPQALLALVMDTQPEPELGSLADAARGSAYEDSDQAAALRRGIEEEVRTSPGHQAQWLQYACKQRCVSPSLAGTVQWPDRQSETSFPLWSPSTNCT